MAECCIQKVPQDIKGIDEFTSQWRPKLPKKWTVFVASAAQNKSLPHTHDHTHTSYFVFSQFFLINLKLNLKHDPHKKRTITLIPPTAKYRKYTTMTNRPPLMQPLDKPLRPCHLCKTIATIPPITDHVFHPNITLPNLNSHCAKATMTNPFTQATQGSALPTCHTQQTISPMTNH